MIAAIAQWSVRNRGLVLIAALVLAGWGLYAVRNTPVDAIPDLSDVQVIVKTSYPGQAPQVVQDQVTYPLTSAMLAVPKSTTVRGFSFYGDSYVYVIFEEGTDVYWARARVLEYLSQVRSELPDQAEPELGPDATGVGWVFNYALVDRSGQHSLADLRSLQDWFLRYELQALPGIAEIATVGGMVRQYQVEVDPLKLRAYNLPLAHVRTAIERANQEAGASVVEMAEAEYMVRASGYIQSLEDLAAVPLGTNAQGTPLLLGDIASIEFGPQMRRGIADLNGEGEVVGGIVVMRYGENAAEVIARVKQRLAELQPGLPAGVEVVTTYDRSQLIHRAVSNLQVKLVQELLVVGLVCALFLFHLRSALVVMISLPLGVLCAYIVMHAQGISANIMSLGGVAIAIGAMVDGAVVMIENLHKHLEREQTAVAQGRQPRERWAVVAAAAGEVAPALFFSLLIITLSFLPVFALEAQEGRMFSPLAFTKTYAMAASAGLAVTLVPVLLGYCVRGRVLPEHKNPVNRLLIASYRPLLRGVLRFPKIVLSLAVVLMVVGLWPAQKLGTEFMPPLDEGDLMYMPTTYAGISVGEARQILQQTDKLIKTVPEVETVFGKVGRAETATDPAPLTMIETVIQLKPRHQWRPGVTAETLRAELNSLVNFPGLSNAFVMPIKTRIDMLATGIKTPVGIKIAGPDLDVIENLGRELETLLSQLPGTASAYAERVVGGRYIKIDIRRQQAARHGLSVADVQAVVSTAIGGQDVTHTVEGPARYPVNLRYPQHYRNSVDALQQLPIVTDAGHTIALGDVAAVFIEDGPPVIKSENARLNGWVLVDTQGQDLGSYVAQARQHVDAQLALPQGYSLQWAGQYQYMERAKERLSLVIPFTFAIIVLLLYLNFRRMAEVVMILVTLPLGLLGGIWLLLLLEYELSVAVAMGLIALAGVAVEIGILMLVYLNLAVKEQVQECNQRGTALSKSDLHKAVMEGAGLRLRPIVMTALTLFAGLLPIMLADGSGAELMQRIAGPMVGGIFSTLILSLLVLPAMFYWWHGRHLCSREGGNNP